MNKRNGNNVKRVTIRIAAVVAILLFAATGASAQILDQPVAVVRLTETVNIGQRELRQQARVIESQMGRELNLENRKELLDAQIAEILIKQAAARANIRITDSELNQAIAAQRQSIGQPVTDEQFRSIIQQQTGLSWDQYRTEIRNRLLQERYVLESKRALFESVAAPTEQQIRDFYDDNATEFTNPTMARFRHVFVDTRNATAEQRAERRRLADELLRSVRNGNKTLDQLIAEADDDPRFSGGDFGFLIRQESQQSQLLGRPFVDAVFQIEEGSIGREVIESNVGFHVVQVTNRRSARILGLTDPIFPGQSVTVRDQIRNHLTNANQQRVFQRAVNEVVADLRREADIRLFEQNLNW